MSSKFTQIMRQPRSTLAPYASSMRDPDPAAAKLACKQAWHKDGILVINMERLDEYGFSYAEKLQVEATGIRLYGKRGNGK